MNDEKKFVTDDDKGEKLDPIDIAARTASDGIAITSAEQLLEYGRLAKARFDEFEGDIAMKITPARARVIRHLRVDEHYSWRAVASECALRWGADATWEPPSNQLAGMALCKLAALSFGEDYYDEGTWN